MSTTSRMVTMAQRFSEWAKKAGLMYGGKRDIYATAGYIPSGKETFDDYWSLYRRNPIAERIVTLPAVTTWREPPEIVEEGKPDGTEFTRAFETLAQLPCRFGRALRVARANHNLLSSARPAIGKSRTFGPRAAQDGYGSCHDLSLPSDSGVYANPSQHSARGFAPHARIMVTSEISKWASRLSLPRHSAARSDNSPLASPLSPSSASPAKCTA